MSHAAITRRAYPGGVVSVLVLLCVLLAACTFGGFGSSSTGPQSGAQPGINTGGVATVNGLQLNTTISCGLWVVLKSHAPTYGADELAAIKTFLSKHTAPLSLGTVTYDPQALPATLQYVPGQLQCSGTYELTNTGSSLIQINQIGFQNSRTPTQYTYQYHLIDACPYLQDCGCGGCGAAEACAYGAEMALRLSDQPLALTGIGLSNHGNGIIPIPPGDPDCPNVINLQPGGDVSIEMFFDPPSQTAGSWFHGVPAVNVTTAQGTTTLTYPRLDHDLVFAPLDSHGLPSPNTCVVQRGSTFVPVTSFARVPDASKSAYDPYYIPRCV
jgi:hypothetical protein